MARCLHTKFAMTFSLAARHSIAISTALLMKRGRASLWCRLLPTDGASLTQPSNLRIAIFRPALPDTFVSHNGDGTSPRFFSHDC